MPFIFDQDAEPHDPMAPHRSDTFRAELTAGLLARQAVVSAKYLYDTLGSRLFEAICALPEYYPTRTEAAIFAAHREEIAQAAGAGRILIDLGAGNCAKAASLFPVLRPARYVPVDISAEFLQEAVSQLRLRFPQIEMAPIGADFSTALDLPESVPLRQRLFFYPGSSIGNFAPNEALALLRRIRNACDGEGGLLIGVDLVKDKRILDEAYDDALGVTAAFNLNLLRHLNRLLDAEFEVRDWQHRAGYVQERGRIEMHLQARRDLTVNWPGGRRHFREGETIHTENSYKYTAEEFTALLSRAGFDQIRTWTDARRWFMVCHARAA